MSRRVLRWLLVHLSPGLVLCATLAAGGWWLYRAGYDSGYQSARATGDLALVREQKARADERRQLSAAGLLAAQAAREQERQQRERGDRLSMRLAEKESELQQASALLQLNISKAVSDDNKNSGNGYNGIGPHSLQLYERALGYAGRGDASTGNTAER
ncbi:hypothetical protein [Yokenella regensburgei]|uniref:hypothetical protein n=1 Tax=Yokenella regensburgei TaxID=158877 RepID=UPI0013763BC1|nr:hypothetical protein [Yokenella regensburgei]KAF1366525.1 hypothetical protein FHR25_004988 [Yokenella regensburgei]